MDSVPTRTCRKCGGEKNRKPHGDWVCAPCAAKRQREWKASRTPEQLAASKSRANELRKRRRRDWTPEQQERQRQREAAWRATNRTRHLDNARRWYEEHPERAKANRVARYARSPEMYYANNLVRKARVRAAICVHGDGCVDAEFLAEIYSRSCVYCGDSAEHADHLTPLARGGLHCRDNIVPACADCNERKQARDPFEWLVSLQ